jgi:hypothetical protein
LERNYLSLIKQSLFAEQANCFDAVSETLFLELLKGLFASDYLALQSLTIPIKEWFYPGSPCLPMTLSNEAATLRLYLHPRWVLSKLPQSENKPQILRKRSTALDAQELLFRVELSPLKLSLGKVMCLQVGDLIKTAHSLDKPLILLAQQEKICEVELTKNQTYKSVQLRRPL